MVEQTSQIFKWSDRRYTLNKIEEQYGAKLPQIVLVAEGYNSSNSPYTISSSDIFFIKSIAKQPRLVVEDEKKRLLSIPLDYSVKFNVVWKSRSGGISLGPSRKLREILHDNPLNTIKQLMLEMNESVSVLSGAEDAVSGVLGVMTVQDIYYERYFLAHSLFNDAKMHPFQVEFPVYLPITVRLAVGLTMADDRKLADVLSRAMELVTLDPDSEEAFDICFSPDIMLFEARDDDGYEYVNPGGILDWAVKVERELETVERVYDASRTVDIRRRMREQENWQRRRDPDPELLDIGVPIPLPNAKPQLMTSDPFVKEVVERPESPPPPVPKRGQTSRRDTGVPLPQIPIFPEEANSILEPLKKIDENKEIPNETFRGSPSIDQDISASHACESHPHIPLDDGDDHRTRSDHSTADTPNVRSLPDNVENSGLSCSATRRGQRPFSVAGWPSSHYDPTLYSRHENPYEFEREPLMNQTRKLQTAEEHRDHGYDYARVQRIRLCGDGGNEVVSSTEVAQNMALKSSDIVQWADVPDDISTLTVGDVNACLRLLNLTTEVEDVDGAFLMELSEDELKDFFQMSGLQAKKLVRFTRGWRPRL